jgi:hypothetical protein
LIFFLKILLGKLYYEENENKIHNEKMRLQVVGNLLFKHLMGIEDSLKSPKSIGDLVGNTYKAGGIFWEKPKYNWRPVGPISTVPPDVIIGCLKSKNSPGKSCQPIGNKESHAGPIAHHVSASMRQFSVRHC